MRSSLNPRLGGDFFLLRAAVVRSTAHPSKREVSRCNQYLSKMLLAFEQIKHIFQYRTPRNATRIQRCHDHC